MTKNNAQKHKPGRSIASHLEVFNGPNDPPPTPSQSFVDMREHVTKFWGKFEIAENALVCLDDEVDQKIRK